MFRQTMPTLVAILMILSLISGCTNEDGGNDSAESSTFKQARAEQLDLPLVEIPTAYHAASVSDIPSMTTAIRQYFGQQHDISLETLNAIPAPDQNRPAVHLWRAMNQLLLEQPEEARASALKALTGDPELGLAHGVIGDSYSSVSNKELADDEKAWDHYVAAVEAKNPDPYAWFDIWREAIIAGHPEWEDKALRAIASADLFTDALLANTRWAMKSAPQNAILLVNGDMDTYPALVLQATENLRPDLVIANLALMNTPEYVMHLVKRYGLSWPAKIEELEDMNILAFEDRTVMLSEQIVLQWLQESNEAKMDRLVAAALTVNPDNLSPFFWQGAVLVGGCQVYELEAYDLVDTEAIDRSLSALDADVLMGQYVSPTIINPAMFSTSLLIGNPVTVGLRSTQASLSAEEPDKARACFAIVERLVMAGDLEDDFSVLLEQFRTALASAPK